MRHLCSTPQCVSVFFPVVTTEATFMPDQANMNKTILQNTITIKI